MTHIVALQGRAIQTGRRHDRRRPVGQRERGAEQRLLRALPASPRCAADVMTPARQWIAPVHAALASATAAPKRFHDDMADGRSMGRAAGRLNLCIVPPLEGPVGRSCPLQQRELRALRHRNKKQMPQTRASWRISRANVPAKLQSGGAAAGIRRCRVLVRRRRFIL